jgi:hypothetical protein
LERTSERSLLFLPPRCGGAEKKLGNSVIGLL